MPSFRTRLISVLCPSSVKIIGISLGPILAFLTLDTKKSPVGVNPLMGSPSEIDVREAFLYQEDIAVNLSYSSRKSSLYLSREMLISCFLETAVQAMNHSPQAKKHAFAGFDSTGAMMGCGINRTATSAAATEAGYPWGAHHAEFDLFSNGFACEDVSFFIGVRVNRFREFRCSVPCIQCSRRYGQNGIPVFALDWNGKIVRCNPHGKHEDICIFPGAQK